MYDMKNLPVLITGCQRSGTTLMHLILDSHPDIVSFDEFDYREDNLSTYLSASEYGPRVAFKLPTYASGISWIRRLLPELQVVWCVRDPRDVVASMLALRFTLSQNSSISWCSDPMGAAKEIDNCVPVLAPHTAEEIGPYLERYRAIQSLPPLARSREDDVFVGALCWRIKNEIPSLYEKEGILYYQVRYENLVRQPREEISRLMASLGVQWHDDVLRHHKLHTGIHLGGTDFSRAIDSTKVGRWRTDLNSAEVDVVQRLTSDVACKFGYEMPRHHAR